MHRPYSALCSEHFEDKYFMSFSKRLTDLASKNRLKVNAVPTLHKTCNCRCCSGEKPSGVIDNHDDAGDSCVEDEVDSITVMSDDDIRVQDELETLSSGSDCCVQDELETEVATSVYISDADDEDGGPDGLSSSHTTSRNFSSEVSVSCPATITSQVTTFMHSMVSLEPIPPIMAPTTEPMFDGPFTTYGTPAVQTPRPRKQCRSVATQKSLKAPYHRTISTQTRDTLHQEEPRLISVAVQCETEFQCCALAIEKVLKAKAQPQA